MVYIKKENPFAWEAAFPPVYGQTSISYLKNSNGFCKAKSGDMYAALEVVEHCVNFNTINGIKRKYPDATLLPVITNNKLPEALASTMGMKTHTEVYTQEKISRKSLSAMARLLHKPVFKGRIVKGERYIIVDDVITQGGTVSALRKHVISNGGTVEAIAALSCAAGSTVLVPNEEDVFSLANRFNPNTITDTLRKYNIAHDLWELTRPQIRYLLLFKELEGLIEKIEKTCISNNV